jgi:hypothetical protein
MNEQTNKHTASIFRVTAVVRVDAEVMGLKKTSDIHMEVSRNFLLSVTAASTGINSVTLKLETSRPSVRHLICPLCENPKNQSSLLRKP